SGGGSFTPLALTLRGLRGSTAQDPHHPGPLLPTAHSPSPGEEGEQPDRPSRAPLSRGGGWGGRERGRGEGLGWGRSRGVKVSAYGISLGDRSPSLQSRSKCPRPARPQPLGPPDPAGDPDAVGQS